MPYKYIRDVEKLHGFLDLSTRWRWVVVTFTLWPCYRETPL